MKKSKNIKIIVATAMLMAVLGIAITYEVALKEKDNEYSKNDLIAVYLEDDSGNYVLKNLDKFPTEDYVLDLEKSSCKNGGALSQNAETKSISLLANHNDSCNLYFKKHIDIIKNIKSKSRGVRNNFVKPLTTGPDVAVYEMNDSDGVAYYLTGAQTTNYVKFAGFYWRIMRVNGDGSLRIIYDGTMGHPNGYAHEDRVAGTSSWDSSLSYGIAPSFTGSDLKTNLEVWYETYLKYTDYSQYIHDSEFCYDMDYAGVEDRLVTRGSPSLVCSALDYTYKVSYGNLDYPLGVISADEYIIAGGGEIGTDNTDFYLYKGIDYWTGTFYTPSRWSDGYFYGIGNKDEFTASGGNTGKTTLQPTNTSTTLSFAPVISLRADYVATMEGKGTWDDPFTADQT